MPNTINIVQPKAEDGVTEISYVTRTNSIFKSDGSPLGDSMDAYMDEVDELSQNLAELAISGISTNIMSLPTSGTNYSYTVTEDGWYTVKASSAGTSGILASRIMVGTTDLVFVQSSPGAYTGCMPSPIYLKKGIAIKALAIFPSGGSGNLIKLS